jgi:hypothetical protein
MSNGLQAAASSSVPHIYAPDPEGLRICAELESFWSAALTSFKRLAEAELQA